MRTAVASQFLGFPNFQVTKMGFFDRISNSFALARSSWRVLWTDKQLVVFPIVSGICLLCVSASFFIPFLVIPGAFQGVVDGVNNNGQPPVWVWPLAFAYYFCNYFVIIFCNAALVSCATIRFSGGTPSLADGFGMAFRRAPQIFAWALVSATVGILLKAIENAHERAGVFISAILGTAWSIMTYFVVPVLVVEKVGPFQAVGRSISILKKTWGEALVGSFGLGFFKLLVMLPGILVLVIGIALCTVNLLLGLPVALVGVLCLLLGGAVSAALDGVFLTALYQYATNGAVPVEFDRGTLGGAFYAR
jgi:hypothetical protein